MDYLDIANSGLMWLACVPGVALIIFQALIFMKMAYKNGQQMGMDRAMLNVGMRAGLISAIGPSFAILIGMMALILNMGAPFSWMRLSYIGSIMYELLAADMGAQAVGTTLGAADFGKVAFASAVWTQTLGAIGWLVIVAVAAHKLEIIRVKLAGGKVRFLPLLSVAAMLGAFAYQASSRLLQGGGSMVAVIVGMAFMMFFVKIAHRYKQGWLLQWSLGFAMLLGMFAGGVVPV
ncbi:MAG: DUF5058 family protein [Chloroflexota bacterium]|jgi:hypothetical protein